MSAHSSLAYVLKRFTLSDGRYIVDVLTREQGRLRFLAQRVDTDCVDVRGVLRAFQLLSIEYLPAQKELLRLVKARTVGSYAPMPSGMLMCAFYLNELILRLIPVGDQHTERLFDRYGVALVDLMRSATDEAGIILRRFERDLLQEMGYAIFLIDRIDDHSIQPDLLYSFTVESGFTNITHETSVAVAVLGQSILDIRADQFDALQTRRDMKRLFAYMIQIALQGKILKTKKVLNDVSLFSLPDSMNP